MKRILLKNLKEWKEKKDRKPLILQGARQVGKTWLLQEFGRQCFDDVCYINFERNAPINQSFEGVLDPRRIIHELSLHHGRTIQPQKTLIIFDEIQEVPRALTSLKYFCEETPEYAICCAGSQLGVALHEGTSFPVGKVEFLHLRPMSFREFLIASDKENLANHILDGNLDVKGFDDELQQLLKTYFIVGGMPAAVSKWIETNDFFAADRVLANLSKSYLDDFSKHAPQKIVEKLRYVWTSIPSQLARENKKFVFGLVREGARAREYEEALMWLSDMGLVIRSSCIEKPGLPLQSYEDLKSFKIYLLDVGLLRHMSGLSPKVLLEGSRVFEEFKGALTEQYTMQEMILHPNFSANHYWTSSGKAELDFVFSDGLNVYPLEAKSDINVKAKSLKIYDENYSPKQFFISSLRPYHRKDRLTYIPLYMLFALPLCIGE